MQFDPLSDAFVRMYNAEQAGHYEVSVRPASKLLGSMLDIIKERGYIGEFEKIDDGRERVALVCKRPGVFKKPVPEQHEHGAENTHKEN